MTILELNTMYYRIQGKSIEYFFSFLIVKILKAEKYKNIATHYTLGEFKDDGIFLAFLDYIAIVPVDYKMLVPI